MTDGAAGQSVPKKILIVEDSEDILSIVRFLLKREGFEVLTAADGRQAEKMIDDAAPPDAVVLDVMLPYVDGFTLLKKIRASASWRNVVVIMLTAKSGQKDVLHGLDSGADDYMVKPFDTAELLARLRRLLRR
ncbi:MAG: response regulator [Nitrospinae bacterium]|nr:response regulator [Nitrospinota bacterium]